MYGTVEIGGKSVELSANAATAFRMKQIFDIDLMRVFADAETDGGIGTANVLPQLTYIMNCQATKADMNKLNFNTFLTWCEDFEALDIANAGEQIINIYLGNMKTKAVAKKK